MEASAPRTWYGRFAEGELNFKGGFQPLDAVNLDRRRSKIGVMASDGLQQAGGSEHESMYMVSVTIDFFQAGIVAITSGAVRELRAKMPVHIGDVIVRVPSPGTVTGLNIKAISEPVGMGTMHVSGELYGHDSQPVWQISHCRRAEDRNGSGNGSDGDGSHQRHPTFRVIWDLDIARLSAKAGPYSRPIYPSSGA